MNFHRLLHFPSWILSVTQNGSLGLRLCIHNNTLHSFWDDMKKQCNSLDPLGGYRPPGSLEAQRRAFRPGFRSKTGRLSPPAGPDVTCLFIFVLVFVFFLYLCLYLCFFVIYFVLLV